MSSERMAVGLLFVAIIVLASMAPPKSDTWWLIRAGQDIWQATEVPALDMYSHTIRGRPWPNHEWLTDVLFYGAHRAAGMRGLALLCVLLIAFSMTLSWRMMSGPFEARFILFALSLTAAAGAWAMRPQLVTMACFISACWLLMIGRFWWLPLHFLIWANLHGGVVLGVIAIGAVGLAEIIRTRRIPFQLVLVGIVSAAVTLATPLGLDLWRLLATYGAGARGQGIEEWMRPGPPPANLVFWAAVAALVIGALVRMRTLDAAGARLTAVALAVLPLGLSAIRNISIFLLVAVPAVSALWVGSKSSSRTTVDRNPINTAILTLASVGAVVFVGFLWTHPPAGWGWTPFQSGALIAVTECQGPLYNTYDDGGPLIWFAPRQPVFIDSRYDPYPVEQFLENRTVESTGDYRALFQQYRIRCAIVPAGAATDVALRSDASWTMTYSDDHRAVHQAR
jgi:hypothetical protein